MAMCLVCVEGRPMRCCYLLLGCLVCCLWFYRMYSSSSVRYRGFHSEGEVWVGF